MGRASDARVAGLLEQASGHFSQGRLALVERACRKALSLAPGEARALHLLGLAQLRGGDAAAAVLTLRRAVATEPRHGADLARALLALRALQALQGVGALEEAAEVLRGAVAARPDDGTLRVLCGNIAFDRQLFGAAEADYRAALALFAGDAVAARNLGNALCWQRRLGEARAAYEMAARAQPDWGSPRFHLALLDLLDGAYARGFRLYEHRLGEPALAGDRVSDGAPAWQGADPAGRTILVHDEQGFGDSIFFARFVPVLVERGARVILQVRPALVRLMADNVGVDQVIARGTAVPAHDLRCALPSLPLALGVHVGRAVPYLIAPADAVTRRGPALPRGRRRIGVTWTAGPAPAHRSIGLALLAPLFAAAADFVPVQRDVSDAETAMLLGWPNVVAAAGGLDDFADTAAVLAALDLVITVDTAVANLAGALGRPVWLALGYFADWRWGLSGDRCVWYPTARLFRQAEAGDWAPVVAAMAAALD